MCYSRWCQKIVYSKILIYLRSLKLHGNCSLELATGLFSEESLNFFRFRLFKRFRIVCNIIKVWNQNATFRQQKTREKLMYTIVAAKPARVKLGVKINCPAKPISSYSTLRFNTLRTRVTQICVFILQLCKMDDANLRF